MQQKVINVMNFRPMQLTHVAIPDTGVDTRRADQPQVKEQFINHVSDTVIADFDIPTGTSQFRSVGDSSAFQVQVVKGEGVRRHSRE